MAHKKIFKRKEIAEIRELLKEKVRSSRAKKKVVRAKIRKIGFYISDFRNTNGEFTVNDLNLLIRKKIIKLF